MAKKGQERTAAITGLPNTPAHLSTGPVERLSLLAGGAVVTNGRLWLALFVCLLVIGGLATALVRMAEKREVVPYLLKVDEKTGDVVGAPVRAADFRPDALIIRAEAAGWVRRLLTLDPIATKPNLQYVSVRTAKAAVGQFQTWLADERPFERLAKQDGLVRTVEVRGTDLPSAQQGSAVVFVDTFERIGAAEPIVTRFNVTLNYILKSPTKEAEIYENPIGFYVTSFTIQKSSR